MLVEAAACERTVLLSVKLVAAQDHSSSCDGPGSDMLELGWGEFAPNSSGCRCCARKPRAGLSQAAMTAASG